MTVVKKKKKNYIMKVYFLLPTPGLYLAVTIIEKIKIKITIGSILL